ncbi:MAG TPA: hypothetical protein VFV63_08630 [Ilumatobacteraceae bacterium]|nr:hypothetical protein [Ilumatobacteraceae bacterium]
MDEATLRRLYTTVPTEFVAARNDVVKELRRAKQRDEAAVVAALRKPDWTEWALNIAAMERSDAVAEFVGAAIDVRDAQTAAIEGRDGPDVRTALRTLRDRTADVIRTAASALEGAGRGPGTAELTSRLSEIAGNAQACEQLRMGVLGSADPDASDPFAGLQPPDRPRSRRDTPDKVKAAKPVAGREPLAASEPKPSAAERQQIRRERERAEKAHKTAVRDLAAAKVDLDRATVDVATAREKLAAAEQRQADATERRLAAEEKLAQAEAAISSLTPS